MLETREEIDGPAQNREARGDLAGKSKVIFSLYLYL